MLPKNELLPAVYIAAFLTRAVNGVCIASTINTTETDRTVLLPWVQLEELAKEKVH